MTLTDRAQRRLEVYLRQVAAAADPADAESVVHSLREHVAAEAAAQDEPLTFERLDEILEQLGEPASFCVAHAPTRPLAIPDWLIALAWGAGLVLLLLAPAAAVWSQAQPGGFLADAFDADPNRGFTLTARLLGVLAAVQVVSTLGLVILRSALAWPPAVPSARLLASGGLGLAVLLALSAWGFAHA